MANKLTAIKIKYNDQTYSNKIPIAALAENISWDQDRTLIDVLGVVNPNLSISSQLNQLYSQKVSYSDLSSYVNTEIANDVSDWLDQHLTPVGEQTSILIDDSLTVSGAGADAKIVGDEFTDLKDALFGGNVNQHFKVNPFVVGSGYLNTALGTLIANRATATILSDGSIKLTRTSTSATVKTFGMYLRIKESGSSSVANHKFYIRLSDVDVSHVSTYDYMIISGARGSDGAISGISSTNITLTSGTSGTAEIIVTSTADFELFNIFAHSVSAAAIGEYFTIGYAQFIDLTDMFGAGYEPTMDVFKSVYSSGMPYPFTMLNAPERLNPVKTLLAEKVLDCDIVETNEDIASTTKDYVLVLNNESRYSHGGSLLLRKMSVNDTNGYTRTDGTRVCAVPDQGALGASNAPVHLMMPIIKSYMDNSSLSFGRDHGMFSSEVTDELDCSDFVCAVLQGIPYEMSRYISGNTANTSAADITNESFSKLDTPSKLTTWRLAEYFAENKRLFSLYPESDADAYQSLRKLQFGDILFISDDEESDYTTRYYHIRHTAIVLMQFGDGCLVAESGGSGALETAVQGTQTGHCARLNLLSQESGRYVRLFARPDYSQSEEKLMIDVLKGILSGSYEITIGNDYIPGYNFNPNTFEISNSIYSGITPNFYDAIGGSILTYTGALKDANNVSYYVAVVEYDSQYKPIRKTAFLTTPVTLDASTRYVRFQFGFAQSQAVENTYLHTGDAFKATMQLT